MEQFFRCHCRIIFHNFKGELCGINAGTLFLFVFFLFATLTYIMHTYTSSHRSVMAPIRATFQNCCAAINYFALIKTPKVNKYHKFIYSCRALWPVFICAAFFCYILYRWCYYCERPDKYRKSTKWQIATSKRGFCTIHSNAFGLERKTPRDLGL